VIVPVYNGAATLPPLCLGIRKAMEALSLSFEILLVDDGSTDRSWETIDSLHAGSPCDLKGYRLARNGGQQAATLCGLLRARGEFIITIDDDLQTPPEEIAVLWQAARDTQADVVYGVCPALKHNPVYNLSSRLFRRVFRLISGGYPDGSSFRLIRASTVRMMEITPWVFIDAALSWVTENIVTVKVRHEKRRSGRSGYSPVKIANLALTLVIVYSTLPLRLMIWAGLGTSLVSFSLGLFFLYRKLTVGAQVGFSALIVTLTLTSGVILLGLGILGEYISRIYAIQTGRRPFTVKSELT